MESQYAVAMPVTALVAPGPEVTRAVPTLLVAHQNMVQLRMLGQFVVYVDNGSARIPEQNIHAFFLKRFKKDLRTCKFHLQLRVWY